MAEIFYRAPEYNPDRDIDYGQKYIHPDLLDVLGVVGRQTLENNPLPTLDRIFAEDEPSPVLSAEDANKKYGQPGTGVRFEEPVMESTAKKIADRHLIERQRQDYIQSGPQGFLAGAAKFGTAIGASFLDPVGLVAGFFPSAAAVKGASLLKRTAPAWAVNRGGTIGQRALGGAAEGVIGTTLIEPIMLVDAQKDQMDYDSLDSFLNITIGGIMGGGLHSGSRYFELRSEKAAKKLLDSAIKKFEETGTSAGLDKDQFLALAKSDWLKERGREIKKSELSEAIDSFNVEQRRELLMSAFHDVSLDRLPKNIDALIQRNYLANQPYGLTDFAFKIDGSLSLENQGFLQKKSNGEAAASIPFVVFDSQEKADAFIRGIGDGKNLSKQLRPDGSYVVSDIKRASIVRGMDGLGDIIRFKTYEAAKKHADEIGDAQAVKNSAAIGEEFVVIRGITPDDAKMISRDSSYVEFYEPRQAAKRTAKDTERVLAENGIVPQKLAAHREIEDDLFNYEKMIPEDDRIAYDETPEAAKKEMDDFMAEFDERHPDISEEDRAFIDGHDANISEATIEKDALKMIANCFIRRV